MRWNLLCVFLVCVAGSLFSQNLDKIGTKDMFEWNGSIQTSSNFSFENQSGSSRSSLHSLVHANLNLQFLDLSFPFAFSYSNGSTSFSKLYNMASIHPRHKKFQMHLGKFSVGSSPFVISGKPIEGFGFEVNGRRNKIQAYSGRFQRQNLERKELNQKLQYERQCVNLIYQFNFSKSDFFWEYFLAFDNEKKANSNLIYGVLAPERNEIMHCKINQQHSSFLDFNLEYFVSLHTANSLLKSLPMKGIRHGILGSNSSSRYYSAIKTTMNLKSKQNRSSLSFEKTDPGYISLGSLANSNDRMSISFKSNQSVFKNRLVFNLNSDWQTNNVLRQKKESMQAFNEGLTLSLNLFSFLSLQSSLAFFCQTHSLKFSFPQISLRTIEGNFNFIQKVFSASLTFKMGEKQSRNEFGLSFSESKSKFLGSEEWIHVQSRAGQIFFSVNLKRKQYLRLNLNCNESAVKTGKQFNFISSLNYSYEGQKKTTFSIVLGYRTAIQKVILRQGLDLRFAFEKKIKLLQKKDFITLVGSFSWDTFFSSLNRNKIYSQLQIIYVL